MEQDDRRSVGGQTGRSNLCVNIYTGVEVGDLQDQQDIVSTGERSGIGIQQQVGRLALTPLEDREKREACARPIARDAGIEVVGVHAQGHHVERGCDTARAEGGGVEGRRHPHLVHSIAHLNPFGRDAVDLEHRVANAIATAVLREHLSRRVHDLGQVQVLGTLAHRSQTVIVPVDVHPVCSVDIGQADVHAQLVQLEEQLPRRYGVARSGSNLRLPKKGMPLPALEPGAPLLPKRSPRRLIDAREVHSVLADTDVLMVHKRHRACTHRAEACVRGPQAVVRILVVGEVVLIKHP